jgi:hypothetical protein
MLNCWGIVSYANALADKLHSQNQLLLGNGACYYLWWHMANVDIPGREISVLKNNAWNPPDDSTYMYFRSIAGKRPFWTLLNDTFENRSVIERYFKHSLFYGIFPSMFHAHTGTSIPYFEQPAYYNRDRDLFKKYVPLIRILDDAGWQSVPWAWAEPSTIRIERFGNGFTNNVYYTLWNTTNNSQKVKVVISKCNIGLSQIESITEMILGHAVPIVQQDTSEIQFELQLPANDYTAVKIDRLLRADLNDDGVVNINALMIFAESWLKTYESATRL